MPLATIHFGQRRLSDYAAAVEPNVLAELRRLAEPLAGLRVLHLSAGPFGSVVAETLAALVPLQRDLGILADWQLLRGDAPGIWLALYQGLAGGAVRWGRRQRSAWHAYAERHARMLPAGYDIVVAHDPQAVALARAMPAVSGGPRWIWHCHLDPRAANPAIWADLRSALKPCAAALFPAPELVPSDLDVPNCGVARPALDPCSPRNLPLPTALVTLLLSRLGLDPNRPIIGQFAPIDQRYAPMGALGTYWLARREIPGLQIVLVDLSVASANREQPDLDRIAEAAAADPDIHLVTQRAGLGATEINALQRGVAVALQLAVPYGFGWGLADCQWKSRPTVVGRHGQLPEQVSNGESGFVVDGAPDAAEAVVQLLRSPDLAREMGQRGHDRVAQERLITRLLADYLRLLQRVTGKVQATAPVYCLVPSSSGGGHRAERDDRLPGVSSALLAGEGPRR